MITDVLMTLTVAALAVVLYWNSRNGQFLWDDNGVLAGVRREKLFNAKGEELPTQTRVKLRDLFIARHWTRPLLFVTYTRDIQAHGSDHTKWHYYGIALHAVNSACVFAILRYWFEPRIALLAAALAASYPLAQSSVATISGRSSVMAATFYLLSIVLLLIGGSVIIAIPFLMIAAYRSREDSIALIPSLIGVALWK